MTTADIKPSRMQEVRGSTFAFTVIFPIPRVGCGTLQVLNKYYFILEMPLAAGK
jgi:hypothetical protein